MKEIIKVEVRKEVKDMLIVKKKATGRSMAELTEFAIINMPFIPPKGKGKSLIRKN